MWLETFLFQNCLGLYNDITSHRNALFDSCQRKVDDDCVTELAVHYGRTKQDTEAEVQEVSKSVRYRR